MYKCLILFGIIGRHSLTNIFKIQEAWFFYLRIALHKLNSQNKFTVLYLDSKNQNFLNLDKLKFLIRLFDKNQ